MKITYGEFSEFIQQKKVHIIYVDYKLQHNRRAAKCSCHKLEQLIGPDGFKTKTIRRGFMYISKCHKSPFLQDLV